MSEEKRSLEPLKEPILSQELKKREKKNNITAARSMHQKYEIPMTISGGS